MEARRRDRAWCMRSFACILLICGTACTIPHSGTEHDLTVEDLAHGLTDQLLELDVTESDRDTASASAGNATNIPMPAPKNMEDKMLKELAGAAAQSRVRQALKNAREAADAAKAAAERAMTLASTPSERKAALVQVAVAKRVMGSYMEQYKKFNPFAAMRKSSVTFGQMERDAENKEIAVKQTQQSKTYSSELKVDTEIAKQKKKEYEAQVARELANANKPPPLPVNPTKKPIMFTEAQLQEKVSSANEASQKQFAMEKKNMLMLAAKQQHEAIEKERFELKDGLEAARERGNKRVSVEQAKMNLMKQRFALEKEKLMIGSVKHAEAAAALAAAVDAKAEAAKISAQADVVAADTKSHAAEQVIQQAAMASSASSKSHSKVQHLSSSSADTAVRRIIMADEVKRELLKGHAAHKVINLREANERKDKAFKNLHTAISEQAHATRIKTLTGKWHTRKEAGYKAAHKKVVQVAGSNHWSLREYDAAQAALDSSKLDEKKVKQAATARVTILTANKAQKAMNTAARRKMQAEKHKENSDKAVVQSQKKAEEAASQLERKKILQKGAPLAQKMFGKAMTDKAQAATKLAKQEGTRAQSSQLNADLSKAHQDLARAATKESVLKKNAKAKAALDSAEHADQAIIESKKAAVAQAEAESRISERVAKLHRRYARKK